MGIGVWQLVLILAIVVLLFGARKLPTVAGDVAKAIKSFKSGMTPDETKGSETTTRIEGEDVGKESVVKKDEAAQS